MPRFLGLDGTGKIILVVFNFKLFLDYESELVFHSFSQDILHSLENKRENISYKGLRIAVSVSSITASKPSTRN
jgi:hypothetical protein